MWTSRREFVKGAAASGIALSVSRLAIAEEPPFAARVAVPEFYAADLLCPVGKTPLYLGQPVALLIFEDFDTFDQARLALRDAAVLKFGKETGPVTMPHYGAVRFTRVGGA